jgi:F-type H+-transporting ATPase subunit epsilon
MADTLQFDLVSPERRLSSVEARAVRIPGAEGDMTAMPDHAPLITTLRPGILTVETDAGEEEFFVTGGFAEISGTATTVLAEGAMPKGEVTSEILEGLLTQAKEAQASAAPEMADAAAKVVADMVAAGAELGISTSA